MLVAALSASAATAIYAAVPIPFVTGVFYRLVQARASVDGASDRGAPQADVAGSR